MHGGADNARGERGFAVNRNYELTPGYTISRVINGCWQLSEGHSLTSKIDFSDVMRAFHMLTEQGFTTFDCADIYTGAEDFIGTFVEELKHSSASSPDAIQIHTKYVPDLDKLETVRFEDTERIIDRSLKRLRRERLDLVQFHWWDYGVPRCEEVAHHLVRLREKGKIRSIGVTNFDTDHLERLRDAGIPVVSIQSQYSMFDRRVEARQLPWCREHGVAMFCYDTLSGGFLSEKYLGAADFTPQTRSQVKYMQIIEDSLGLDGMQKLLGLLKEIAGAHGVSVSAVATHYILCQPGVAAAIVGVRNSRHVLDNAKLFSFDLTEAEKAAIRGLRSGYPDLPGDPYTLERTSPRYRGIIKMKLNGE
ncbi:MAG: aldo/keto reductase [Clostridia bacterium]|nr:aldo/keto reductase [Clostridia bacterium]